MGDVPPGENIAINHDKIGDFDMFTEPTLTVMNGIGQVGATFDTAWQAIRGQITAEENSLGDPVLGDIVSEAFRTGYNAAEPSLTEGANGVVKQYEETATAGRTAVAMYMQTDGYEVPAALKAATRIP